jgi:predicted ArsR family transcriptional regulator
VELTSITPSPRALKALTHPVRLQMLAALRTEGPATATMLAGRLGLNTGATSYHLRQLARHGFVVDDDERGNARDRWWQAAHQSTRADTAQETAEGREAVDAFQQAVAIAHTEWLQQAMEERGQLPAAWREATALNDYGVRVTPQRARELITAINAVVAGWDEDLDDPEAADLALVLHAFPRPGTLTTAPGEADR